MYLMSMDEAYLTRRSVHTNRQMSLIQMNGICEASQINTRCLHSHKTLLSCLLWMNIFTSSSPGISSDEHCHRPSHIWTFVIFLMCDLLATSLICTIFDLWYFDMQYSVSLGDIFVSYICSCCFSFPVISQFGLVYYVALQYYCCIQFR